MAGEKAETVGIIGAGTMGHGIAQCFAVGGWRVNLFDANPETLNSAPKRIESNLDVFVELGLIGPEQARSAAANIELRPDLASAAAGLNLVIETVSEDLDIKRRLFTELEDLVGAEAVLCTNTSAISIGAIAEPLKRPERLVGTHFWNPPHILPCVEIVRSRFTADEVFEQAIAIMAAIGKEPIRVDKDVPGFLGNRMQHALQREAMSLVESGVAAAEDVDKVVRYGFGLRLALMGPLERADLGGLDITLSVQDYLLSHLDNRTTPSPLLRRKVEQGELGAKAGRGFYDWPQEKLERAIKERDRALLKLIDLVAGRS